MNYRIYFLLMVTLIITVIDLGTGSKKLSHTNLVLAQTPECDQEGTVKKIEGKATVKKPNHPQEPLKEGSNLCRGDIIEVNYDANVTIYCTKNGKTRYLNTNKIGITPFCKGDKIINGNILQRNSDDLIFSPRNSTLVFNNNFKIDWFLVSDSSTSYKVTLKTIRGTTVWEDIFDQNTKDEDFDKTRLELLWNGSKKVNLTAGEKYTINITATTNDNKVIISPPVRFQIIDKKQEQEVRDKVELIKQKFKDDQKKQTLELAKLYNENNLLVNALETLEKIVNNNPDEEEYFELYNQVRKKLGIEVRDKYKK